MSLSEATSARVNIPGPGGHPAPSGHSPQTRLGRAPEAGTAATADFTPPSWDPAARYRQPCTSSVNGSALCGLAWSGQSAGGLLSSSFLTSPAPQPWKESPQGRCKDRTSLSRGVEAGFMQMVKVNSHIPAYPEQLGSPELQDGK